MERDGDGPPAAKMKKKNELPGTSGSTSSSSRYKFSDKWLEVSLFKNWLSKREQDNCVTAFCKACNCNLINHKPSLMRHMQSAKHSQSIGAVSNTKSIVELLVPKKDEEMAKRAELKISAFIAQHNLPISLADDLVPFIQSTFPDSKIAKLVTLGRTKATRTIISILGATCSGELLEKLKKSYFSVIMDETTDNTIKKQCALSVIYYNESNHKIETQFLGMFEVESGKAKDLCNDMLTWLENHSIPLCNFVGFASDTTNSMVGEFNSVFSHLKEKIPNIACVKCSCHMIHLVASKACLKLPKSIEDFLRSVGSHFSRSSTRQNKLREFQKFFQVEMHKVLTCSNTRWLSLKACVDRTLEQYTVLSEYFRLELYEDPSRITEDIIGALSNKFTKIYLEFMSYTLELLNDFNKLFQSEKPLLHKIRPEIFKLIKTITSNYMDFHYCKTTDALKIEYANPRFFLSLDKMYLGVSAQHSLMELINEVPRPAAEIETFRKSCLSFYIETIKQIKHRFDFSDPIFDTIEQVLEPTQAQKFIVKDLTAVLERFPVLKNDIDIQEVHKEWKNHALLESNGERVTHLDADEYWAHIFEMKDALQQPIFKNLKKVISLLLVLPYSNACVERVFSQLKLIKTDHRNKLNTETIAALLYTKQAIPDAAAFEPPPKMLKIKIKY